MAGMTPIRLEKWVSTKDAKGNWIETVTKYNLWAEVSRVSGARQTQAGRTTLQDSYSFFVRFRPAFDLTANWRIVYRGMRFTVNSIEQVDEKRFFWRIVATGK